MGPSTTEWVLVQFGLQLLQNLECRLHLDSSAWGDTLLLLFTVSSECLSAALKSVFLIGCPLLRKQIQRRKNRNRIQFCNSGSQFTNPACITSEIQTNHGLPVFEFRLNVFLHLWFKCFLKQGFDWPAMQWRKALNFRHKNGFPGVS